MSITQILSVIKPILWAIDYGGPELAVRLTRPGECTVTGWPVVYDEDEGGFLGQLPAEQFPPLPDSGWLEAGEIYRWQGQAVMVRQSHWRTEHDPPDVPALFIVYRPEGGVLEWIPGEQVWVGTRRTYNGVEYECLQAHMTQVDWPPPDTPALWRVVVPPPPPEAPWQPGVWYQAGHIVTYNGVRYECLQTHFSQVGWEPPNVPALWRSLAPPTPEWQPWTWYAAGTEVTYQGFWYRCLQSHTSQPGWEPPNVPALWLLLGPV